ncbi:sulfurtransferase TusA family protein [Sneathiella limimaris]|uniref:sulfurtransferase TusA family protein n=1 Tax=Sneathiella limimaris TaxID=1964213 RepID=UPI00146F31DF|nr:sulfurtransferase TusA family protein [Sneathiella limimaris]
MANHTLDTTGLSCPLPVLKTKKFVKTLEPGDRLTVLATDPASYIDFDHYCHVSGNQLLSHQQDGDTFIYEIEIAS